MDETREDGVGVNDAPFDDRSRPALMIAYAYPPVLASGSNRSVAFAKNLAAFDWRPTILTVERSRSGLPSTERIPDDVRVVRARELNLHGLVELLHGATRRVLRIFGVRLRRNWYRELLCIPDPQIAWMCLGKGLALARTHDVIYVSCSPFSSALMGTWLKKLSGKPLVVDFRDAWSLNPHASYSRPHLAAIRRLERYVIQQCDRLVVNTLGAEALYRKHYPESAWKIVSIPNGYDSLNIADPYIPGTKFTIMHVGNFYGSRVPDALLAALDEIANPDIEFVQVGAAVEGLTSRPGLRIMDRVPHEEALALMRTASLLYLKQGFEGPSTDYIAVAAKTYEYLATGLPILADCPEGDNAEVVRRYCPHPYVVSSGGKSDLKEAVLKAFAARAITPRAVNEEFEREFDRLRLTARLAHLFDELTLQAAEGVGADDRRVSWERR